MRWMLFMLLDKPSLSTGSLGNRSMSVGGKRSWSTVPQISKHLLAHADTYKGTKAAYSREGLLGLMVQSPQEIMPRGNTPRTSKHRRLADGKTTHCPQRVSLFGSSPDS